MFTSIANTKVANSFLDPTKENKIKGHKSVCMVIKLWVFNYGFLVQNLIFILPTGCRFRMKNGKCTNYNLLFACNLKVCWIVLVWILLVCIVLV